MNKNLIIYYSRKGKNYDTIFIGYPIWYADMPMAVYTFLESYDFSDKTVIPFCTHASSGLASTVDSIKNELPQANVMQGLAISEQRFKTINHKLIVI